MQRSSFVTRISKHLVNTAFFRNILRQASSGTMSGAISSTTKGEKHGKANRLANEKSPYLLQHAFNPVEWYPWGKEAFEKAKKENKMIFLSVGYSTCHWCHVMERESFEDQSIGKLMSENFVCIKVDREERPDVDKMYMGFVQATTGSGGWPMSVWLTPDLKPVVGGTYFPPDDRYYGRPGFSSILNYVAEKWKEDPQKIGNQGKMLLDAIAQTSKRSTAGGMPDVKQSADLCYNMISESYDTQWGGFSGAPKFPQPVNINYMLYYYASKRQSDDARTALRMVAYTKKMMAQGGIHDHIAQGFHRYSTDKEWHVPHFEKMLYDQGQLAVAYAEMYQITKEEFYAEITRDILTYVDRDLGHPEGGFYSAEDADSYPVEGDKEKKEGAFCVWTEDECNQLLKRSVDDDKHKNVTLSDVFCKHYNVKANGNVDPFQDPHNELTEKNVLIILGNLEETSKAFDLDVETTKKCLNEAKKILFDARLKRPKPHLDTKMITAWNALMISGFAKASASLSDPNYGDRAVKSAEFIKKYLYQEDSQTLLRSCYVDDNKKVVQISSPIKGFADDYAFLITALLDLYEFVDHDDRWLKWADELQTKMDELFWDSIDNSGYFQCSSDDESILVRMKEDQDGAEPSANSMQVINLVRLANILNVNDYREKAKLILLSFGDRLKKLPLVLPKMMCGFLLYEKASNQIVIVGSPEDAEIKSMIEVVRSMFLPFSVTILLDNSKDAYVKSKNEHLKELQDSQICGGKATAFFCANFSCSLPVNTAADLKILIDEEMKK